MADMPPVRILIVDDEPDAVEALVLLLKPAGYDVRAAHSGSAARLTLRDWRPDIVLLDLLLPDADGLDLLKHFRREAPEVQAVMVTGCGTVPTVVEAMTAGAFSFVEKPIDARFLLAVLERAAENVALAAENRRLRAQLKEHTAQAGIVARCDSMKHLLSLVRKVAPSDANVLLQGENGTGKELVANAIHHGSLRAGGPFVKVNCSAIPAELMESELFGHKRGAFTGAYADRPGVLGQANGGSLLLDEIGEMSPMLQAKMLRVLQEREFTPVGSTRPSRSDFRLICATNVDLDEALSSRAIRQDLFFRISTFTLAIPPLRERAADIPLLAEHFRQCYATRYQRPVEGISAETLQLLQAHRWPGNVRELEHAIERAVIVASSPVIEPHDLPPSLLEPAAATSDDDAIPPHCTLEEIERLAIIRTLERTHWNKRAAADILGVYRPTLYNKMRKHNLMNGGRESAAGGQLPREKKH